MTHQRLYRLSDDKVEPLLHIFGHQHEFKYGVFKGTHYLNAAAVDHGMSAAFGRKELQPEGYCRVEITGQTVEVTRMELR